MINQGVCTNNLALCLLPEGPRTCTAPSLMAGAMLSANRGSSPSVACGLDRAPVPLVLVPPARRHHSAARIAHKAAVASWDRLRWREG